MLAKISFFRSDVSFAISFHFLFSINSFSSSVNWDSWARISGKTNIVRTNNVNDILDINDDFILLEFLILDIYLKILKF